MKILPILISSVMALSSVAYADKAVANLVKRAQQHDVPAMRTLGIRMYKGGSPGIPTDRKVALTWLNMAADQKDEVALVFLGDIYAKGFHTAKNERKAAKFYAEAAQLGNDKAVEAMNKLPVKYALEWHERNAQKKDYDSAIRLAEYYVDKGDGDEARKNFKIAIQANRDKAVKRMAKKDMDKAEIFWRVLADDFKDGDAAMRLADAYGTADGAASNPSEAVKWLRKAAERNHAEAQFRLGQLYLAGTGVDMNRLEAAKWFRLAANQGHENAKMALASCSVTPEVAKPTVPGGNHVEHLRPTKKLGEAAEALRMAWRYRQGGGVGDGPKVIESFRKAAELGHPQAQYALALSHMFGWCVAKDKQEAVKWLREAADRGYLLAPYKLGCCYYLGEGVPMDRQEAERWFRKAAERNDFDALVYFEAHRVITDEKDRETDAAMWFATSAAESESNYQLVRQAESGDAKAQFLLGGRYWKGGDVGLDKREAAGWWSLAAEQGNADAQCSLALYYWGNNGTGGNLPEAVYWFGKSAEQGHDIAQHFLGQCYWMGKGVTMDKQEAAKWWRKAAEQGNAHSQLSLGLCYLTGQGVTMDKQEVYKWWRKSAEQGNADAQCGIGCCFHDGEGVPKDYAEAVKWWRKAAEQGHAQAQRNLAECYYWGDGVDLDEQEAAKWWSKAAQNGDAKAQFCLGSCYKAGKGVRSDDQEAVKWWRKSASQGYDDAIDILNKLGIPME
ncbi:MAG: tetratricopeptide repeat protein [Akkermansia sp.]|nr:tetratricopeptide repeat protein [Akkermansia sp.]